MIWFIFAILSVAAMASVGLSLRAGRGLDGKETSLAIYEDQLEEVDADEARGLIDPADASGARAEIKRRLLARLRSAEQQNGAKSGQGKVPLLLLMIAVPVFGGWLYSVLGSPGVPSVSNAVMAEQRERQQEVSGLAEQLHTRLEAEPDGGRSDGWMLLGQTYLRLERYRDAADAFAVVTQRPEATSATWSLYAEALVLDEQGVVTPPAAEAADRAFELDPTNPAASYYRALAFEQAGQPEQAYDILANQIAGTDGAAPWMQVFADQANRIGVPMGKDPIVFASSQPQAPGPTQEQVEAAAEMSEQDREAFIRSMVDRLATRLEASPDDADGWMRLGNAYMVLGEQEDARAAFVSAQSLLSANPDDPRLAQVNAILTDLQ